MLNGICIPITPLRLLALLIGLSAASAHAQVDPPSALRVRLIHPDRQAAEVLRLFEGSGAKSPAEILARWKIVAQDPNLLGKPLEAVIAMGNPEMAAEWRIFDQTQIRADGTGSAHWFAIVPNDDGTVAAALTAMRLSYDEETPLLHAGRRFPVVRLSRNNSPVACQAGTAPVLGSSRDELARGLAVIESASHKIYGVSVKSTVPAERASRKRSPMVAPAIESGMEFEVDPAEILPAPSASVPTRRLLLLIRSIAGSRMTGSAALMDGSLSAIVRAVRADLRREPGTAIHAAVVDHAWLALIPADHLIGFISLAIDTSEQSRDATFALIDQVERADPARARVASSRTRLNLLAAAVGLRPEVDLWPHVKGVSAAIRGDRLDLGAMAGGWLILHLDRPETATKLLNDTIPRIAASALSSAKPKPRIARAETAKRNPSLSGAGQPVTLGSLAGLAVYGWQADANVVMAWGVDALDASRTAFKNPSRTVAAVCEDWKANGKPSPARVGALWPGRLWIAPREWYDAPATKAIVDLPPIVWWGWTEPGFTTDLVSWTGLKAATTRLVQALPLAANPVP